MTSWNEDLISVTSAGTLDGLFLQRVMRSPERLAYRSYDRDSDTWRDYNWREMADQVARWQAALSPAERTFSSSTNDDSAPREPRDRARAAFTLQ